MKLYLKTFDEEFMPEDRLSREFSDWIKSLNLDTVNHEFIIDIEVTSLDSQTKQDEGGEE